MRRIILPALIVCLSFTACKDSEKKTTTTETTSPADSLLHEVNEGHDAVMPKMGRVRNAQKELQRMIDSISTLPEKTQKASASLKARMQDLVNQLNYADFAMDKWMMEFNRDSALSDVQQRIKYLTEEKLKVDKVKDAVLTGLARADSILKAKL
jgi:hypothetical protein